MFDNMKKDAKEWEKWDEKESEKGTGKVMGIDSRSSKGQRYPCPA